MLRIVLGGLAAVVAPFPAATAAVAADPAYRIAVAGDVYQVGAYRLNFKRLSLSGSSFSAVRRAFGRNATCTANTPSDVEADWPRLGVSGRFMTYGALSRRGKPTRQTGCRLTRQVLVDSLVATGPFWHTDRGLRIGDALPRLQELYPEAAENDDGWWLQEKFVPYGDGAYVGQVVAGVTDGKVSSLQVNIGAQGD